MQSNEDDVHKYQQCKMSNLANSNQIQFTNLNENLLFLNISCCKLTSIDLVLAMCRNLKYLNASGNMLKVIIGNSKDSLLTSDERQKYLLPQSLDELYLSRNQLTNIQSIKFEKSNDQKIKKLHILDISKNQIGNF